MPQSKLKRLIIAGGAYLILGYFTYLMMLITAQYVPIDVSAAFLRIKEEVIAYRHYQIAFFSHVYSSIFVLLAGFTQFSQKIRDRFPGIHRGVGLSYVLLILVVASPSGLVMAYYANGGLVAQVSFSILAILWFAFTFRAFQAAKQRNWAVHQAFMLRSYALTLSAISLRLFKWVIVSIWALPPMETYRIVSVAGWVVNWLLIEALLLYRRRQDLIKT